MDNCIVGCFVLFLSIVNAQGTPAHVVCEIPSEYSGEVYQVLTYKSFNVADVNFGQLYYSQQNQVIRVDVSLGKVKVGDASVTYNITEWIDFSNHVKYLLDRTTGECSSSFTPLTLPSGQIPSNFTYSRTKLFGSQPVHEYFYSKHFHGLNYQIEVGLNAGTCLPFNVEMYKTTQSGEPLQLLTTISMFNTVAYVPPFALEIPPECTSSFKNTIPNSRTNYIREAIELLMLTLT